MSGRLSLIGIGMGSAEDITLRGLNLAKACDVVFLEHYTAILIDDADTSKLEQIIGKKVILADREAVESGAVLEPAVEKQQHVCVLVVGDPLSATTHNDLIERCSEKNIKVDVVGNASILTAVGCVGLQLYRYGQALSLCFWTEGWQPAGYYDKLAANRAIGLHTLLLLDIKVKEISDENLARGRKIYEPPRFMSSAVAARQLLEIESRRGLGVARPDDIVISVARLGSPDSSSIIVARLKDLAAEGADELLGAPLHSICFPGDIHECETDFVILHNQLSQDEETKKISLVNPKKAGEGIKVLSKSDLLKCKMTAEAKKAILSLLASGEIHA
jgi:diphthine methyl ester synthase